MMLNFIALFVVVADSLKKTSMESCKICIHLILDWHVQLIVDCFEMRLLYTN